MWQEASLKWHSLNSLLTERGEECWTVREEFIGKKEIFSESVNREITLSGVGHTHMQALSEHHFTQFTYSTQTYSVNTIHYCIEVREWRKYIFCHMHNLQLVTKPNIIQFILKYQYINWTTGKIITIKLLDLSGLSCIFQSPTPSSCIQKDIYSNRDWPHLKLWFLQLMTFKDWSLLFPHNYPQHSVV